MTLAEAQSIIKEVDGKAYWWLKEWGLSTIKAALRTIAARKSATESDKLAAERIQSRISSGR